MSKWDMREEKKTALVREVGLTENMRRDGVTMNMDPAFGVLGKKSHGEKWDKTLRCFVDHVPSEFFGWANEHPFGGVERRQYLGQDVSITSMLSCYFLWRISKLLSHETSILEIGGGYGGLARVLAEYEPSAKMTMVDLPISLEIQRFYLANTSGATFAFSPEIPDDPFDLAVSTKCLCELDIGKVNHYLTQIDRVLSRSGFFYCVSRDEWKVSRFESWEVPPDWEIVDQRVYPFEPNYMERFWRKIL